MALRAERARRFRWGQSGQATVASRQQTVGVWSRLRHDGRRDYLPGAPGPRRAMSRPPAMRQPWATAPGSAALGYLLRREQLVDERGRLGLLLGQCDVTRRHAVGARLL